MAGACFGNLAATTAYLLLIADAGLTLSHWIRLAQLNAITSASCALAWIAARRWSVRLRTTPAAENGGLLLVQVGIAAALNLVVLAPAWVRLVVWPGQPSGLLEVADAWGWSAGVLAALAIVGCGWVAREARGAGAWIVSFWALGTLVAWTACRRDAGNWLGYHVLLAWHVAVPCLIAIGAWLVERRFADPMAIAAGMKTEPNLDPSTANGAQFDPLARLGAALDRNAATNWSLGGLAVAVALAARALWGDPQAPWWTIGACGRAGLLAVGLACWSLRRGLLYLTAALVNWGASLWWLHWFPMPDGYPTADVIRLVEINIAALALPAVAWLLLELRVFASRAKIAGSHQPTESGSAPRPTDVVPLHRSAVRIALVLLGLIVVRSLLFGGAGWRIEAPSATEWLALAATAVAAGVCLWDAGAVDAIAALYFLGLLAAGVLLDQMRLERRWLIWTADIVLAAYALATSYLWSRRAGLRSLADRLRIPRGPDEPLAGLAWLVPFNCTLVAAVIAMAFWIVLRWDEFSLRLMVANGVLAQMATLGLLARGERRWRLQYASLAVGVLGAVAFGWAWLQPGMSGTLLNRTIVVAAALAVASAIYGLGLTKLLAAANPWLHAARRIAPLLVATETAAIVFVLGTELWNVLFLGHAATDPASIVTVVVLLAGLCATAQAAAVLPGRDPLGLSERGRTAYVYAAEILLALLFAHIRLTKPEWFHGWFERYWPLVVMGIAFIGAAVGEAFRRGRRAVLGNPLENTGALLPLLPVLGCWIVPSHVDYAILLTAVGLLYAALSVARRSFAFGLLAVAAANGSLWSFLNRTEAYRLLDHPQLWLIPPALCVLVAAHLNRRQLSAAQTTAIRYGASIVIYVSSTADIFIQGVAYATELPLVLGGLSLVGVFAGILFRVRAFLIMGTSFLMLALLTIIWHAAVDLQQTWLWSATGIVTGVLILVVFALFEKKRDAVLNLLAEMKKWQP